MHNRLPCGPQACENSLFQRLVLPSFIVKATWAAMSYPEIKAVVLDASFDDLLPLAFKVMPESWSESHRSATLYHGCLSATELQLVSSRAAGAVHGAAVHESQQRGPASEVSLDGR